MKTYAISSIVLAACLLASPIASAQLETPDVPAVSTDAVTSAVENAADDAVTTVSDLAQEKAAEVVDNAADTAVEMADEKLKAMVDDAAAPEVGKPTDTMVETAAAKAEMVDGVDSMVGEAETLMKDGSDASDPFAEILDPFEETEGTMVKTATAESDKTFMTVDDLDKKSAEEAMASQTEVMKEKMVDAATTGKSVVFSEGAAVTKTSRPGIAHAAIPTEGKIKVIVKDADGNVVKEYYRDATESHSGTHTTTTSNYTTTSTTSSNAVVTTAEAPQVRQYSFLRSGQLVTTESGEDLGAITFVERNASGAASMAWVQSFGAREAGKLYKVPVSALSQNGNTVVSNMTAEALADATI